MCRQQHGTDTIKYTSFYFLLIFRLSIPIMDSTTRTAPEKKECKRSDLDASSFSDLPKKPSPTTMSRGVKAYWKTPYFNRKPWLFSINIKEENCLELYAQMIFTFRWANPMHEIVSRRWSNALKVTSRIVINFNEISPTELVHNSQSTV